MTTGNDLPSYAKFWQSPWRLFLSFLIAALGLTVTLGLLPQVSGLILGSILQLQGQELGLALELCPLKEICVKN